MKKKYVRPQILEEVICELEMHLLAGSIVQNIEAVETEGHTVDKVFDGSNSTFNQEWDN